MVDRWWVDVENAVTSLHALARHAGDLPADLEDWCRRAGAQSMIHAAHDIPDLPALPGGRPPRVVGLPGTLEVVENPRHLLDVLADALGPGGRCVAAVTWMTVGPADARRSFHPASLIGLVAKRFLVTEMEPGNGLLGVAATPEPDPHRREAAGLRALLDAQPAVEVHLDQVVRLESRVDALRAAQASLEESVAEADQEHFTARQQRNDARERVRKRDDAVHRLEERLARVEEELQVARDELHSAREHARDAEDRLSRVQQSSWWRARDVVLDVHRRPRGVVLLPRRLRRLRRRRGE